MVNEAIRWPGIEGRGSEERASPVFTTDYSFVCSVPCGVLGGKKVGRRVMGRKNYGLDEREEVERMEGIFASRCSTSPLSPIIRQSVYQF